MRSGADDERHGTPEAGYTYLGQFIDHDLTLDITPPEHAQPHAELIRNFRTPFLDLDHVYGGGPTVSPFLYRNKPTDRGRERFLIGQTDDGSENDVPRNSEGVALVGDPRQDENLIIAQLHVAFLKLHNRVLDDLEGGVLPSAGPLNGTPFEEARRLVIWHYQYVVLHDFLRAVLDTTVFEGLPARSGRCTYAEARPFRIPIEFSAAAFRFGHTMVRDKYHFYNSARGSVSLPDILAQTGSGQGAVPCLKTEWVIDWDHFFGTLGVNSFVVNQSLRIDTSLAAQLHDLRSHTVKLFSDPEAKDTTQSKRDAPKVLPILTLLRGARMGLPSGQDVARALEIENPLTAEEIATDLATKASKVLTQYAFHRETPLWYYILKEAEMRGSGRRLGRVGSRIVADVITSAVLADPSSYLSIDPSWEPSIRVEKRSAKAMIDLLHYATLPPGS
jgi:hypothetical protein